MSAALDTMPVGAVQVAKRALVSVLLSLALAYDLALSVTRDSRDKYELCAREMGQICFSMFVLVCLARQCPIGLSWCFPVHVWS